MNKNYCVGIFLLLITITACAPDTRSGIQPAASPKASAPADAPTSGGDLQPSPAAPEAATLSQQGLDKYLVETFGVSANGGRVFCAYELLGFEQKQDRRMLYLWVQCHEFYLDQERVLRTGAGISLPVVVRLLGPDAGYRIAETQHPRDGEAYGDDVRQLFPENLWGVIFPNPNETPPYASYNKRMEALSNLNQQSALLSFLLSEPGEWTITVPLPVP